MTAGPEGTPGVEAGEPEYPAPKETWEVVPDRPTDPGLERRGSRVGQSISFVVLVAALVGAAVERRAGFIERVDYVMALGGYEIPIQWILAVVAGLAALLWALFLLVPGAYPDVPMPAKPDAAWSRAWSDVRLGRAMLAITAPSTVLSAATLAALYHFGDRIVPDFLLKAAAAALAAFLFMSLATLVIWLRRGPLEQAAAYAAEAADATDASSTAMGSDARVGKVLHSLDGLLGDVSDDHLQAFMQTPEAQAYLDLLAENPDEE